MSKDLLPVAKINKTGIPVIATPKGEEVAVYTTPFNMRVVHPASVANNNALEAYMGQFYFQEIEMGTPELLMVPIKEGALSRTLFPANYDGSAGTTEPLCRSLNGFTPDTRIANPQNLVCATQDPSTGRVSVVCPMAQWINNKPSQCRLSKNVLFFEVKIRVPFYWQLKGTALSAYNKALRDWEKQVNIHRFHGTGTDNLVFKVTLKNKGTYYEPIFEYTTLEEVGDLADVVKYYRAVFNTEEGSEDIIEDESTNDSLPTATNSEEPIDDPFTDNSTDTVEEDDVDEEEIITSSASSPKKGKKKDEGVDFAVE